VRPFFKTDLFLPRQGDSPTDRMENLRTPSYMYNHGGYYGPSDPVHCTQGPCDTCSRRSRPSSLNLTRELTAFKWEAAEKAMAENPDLHVMKVAEADGHVYWLVRYEGKIVRIHERT
jgi:hypothetical protein